MVSARLLLVAVCLAIAACSDDSPPPESNPGPGTPMIPDGFERVTGSERMGWDPQAASAEELATFRYLIYVDEAMAADLQNVSCGPDAAGFSCSAPLPSLSDGQHSLRLSAYVESGGSRLESGRSEPLNVFKVVAASGVSSQAILPIALTTSDGVEFLAEVVADDLDEPVDFAFLPDGSAFIAERGGRIRVWRAGRLSPEPAGTLPDVIATGDGGLLSMAIDPQFDRTGFLYVVYTGESGFRLARLRAVGGTLGDRAILLDGIPFSPSDPSASLRFGPDGQLYLSLDDAGDPRRGGDLGSFNGKTLRLNSDATAPVDRSGSSPIYAADLSAPRGAAWDASAATLWLLDGPTEGPTYLRVVSVLSDIERRAGRDTIVRYALPDQAVGSALAFYLSDRVPALRGNLFVAQKGADGVAAVLRLVFDPNAASTVMRTERLLRGSIDRPTALGVSPDGIIYLGTRRSLITLTPMRAQ